MGTGETNQRAGAHSSIKMSFALGSEFSKLLGQKVVLYWS